MTLGGSVGGYGGGEIHTKDWSQKTNYQFNTESKQFEF